MRDAFLSGLTEELLQRNPMGFPDPAPNTIDYQYRAIRSLCFQRDQETIHSGDRWIPCTGYACCLMEFKVWIRSDNVREAEPTGKHGVGPNMCTPSLGEACELWDCQ